jgi:hypothetical protein
LVCCSPALNAVFVLSYVFWGGAALHPSMKPAGLPSLTADDRVGQTAVAEGVETTELHRLGYQFAQGYHSGKPVAEPKFDLSPV